MDKVKQSQNYIRPSRRRRYIWSRAFPWQPKIKIASTQTNRERYVIIQRGIRFSVSTSSLLITDSDKVFSLKAWILWCFSFPFLVRIESRQNEAAIKTRLKKKTKKTEVPCQSCSLRDMRSDSMSPYVIGKCRWLQSNDKKWFHVRIII